MADRKKELKKAKNANQARKNATSTDPKEQTTGPTESSGSLGYGTLNDTNASVESGEPTTSTSYSTTETTTADANRYGYSAPLFTPEEVEKNNALGYTTSGVPNPPNSTQSMSSGQNRRPDRTPEQDEGIANMLNTTPTTTPTPTGMNILPDKNYDASQRERAEEEPNKIYESFKKDNPNLVGFADLYKDVRDKYKSEIADRFDKDGDGFLNVEEKKEKDEKDGLSKVEATSPELEEAQKALEDFKSGLGLLNEDGTARSRENSQYDRAMAREELRKEQLKKKRGIASGLKSLSQKGALTSALLEEARERSAMAGVSDDQFNTFLEKNGIRLRGSAFSYKKPRTGTGLFDTPRKGVSGVKGESGVKGTRGTPNNTSTPMTAAEAAEEVAYQRQFGTGLNYLDALQIPSRPFGTGTSLTEGITAKQRSTPAQPVGPPSARIRSAARRLFRRGNPSWRAMDAQAEGMRAKEPPINTPADDKRRADQRRAQAAAAREQLEILGQSGDGV